MTYKIKTMLPIVLHGNYFVGTMVSTDDSQTGAGAEMPNKESEDAAVRHAPLCLFARVDGKNILRIFDNSLFSALRNNMDSYIHYLDRFNRASGGDTGQ